MMSHFRPCVQTMRLTILLALLVTLVVLSATPRSLAAQTLRVGLVAEQDIFTQKKLYSPLFEYLGRQLGLSFELQVLPRHGMVTELFARQELDAAFFGCLTAVRAIETTGMRPLVRPHYMEGLASDYAIVFVRRNSGIRSAQDMRNKRLVFVDPASATGYLLPLRYFKEIGIDDYRTWFAQYYFAGTYEDTIYEVIKGHADVGATRSSMFYRISGANPEVLEQLDILASSPHIPSITFGVANDLAVDIVIRLRQELLTMHEDVAGREVLENLSVQRFLLTTREDFIPVKNYAKELGCDLTKDSDAHE
jgi:phosphonate transport system substrate-binding protein